MPLQWVEPAELTSYRGVSVYHTYGDRTSDVVSNFYYTLDVDENEDFEFDVRDLPVPAGIRPGDHALIIQAALDSDSGQIPLPEDVELAPLAVTVAAQVWTDDHSLEVEFDALPWLERASEAAVIALARCGWRGDYPADAVAEGMALKHYRLAGFFELKDSPLRATDDRGFECAVDGEQAMAWLQENRNELYWQVKVALGEAVYVEGCVRETLSITIAKTVTLPMEAAQGGDQDAESLEDCPEFAAAVDDALRDAAYEQSLFDGGHGWEYEGGDAEAEMSFSIVQGEQAEAADA